MAAPIIRPRAHFDGVTYRTGSLPATMSPLAIARRLGFDANAEDDPGKVTMSWGFTVDGHPCGIWDYKGARWSVFDPDGVLRLVFPEVTP